MSRPTLDPARRLGISDTRLSLSPAGLPSPFSYLTSATTQSEPRDARITVWALSISLAATLEIDKFSFSSSGYLDVSVPRVPHVQLSSALSAKASTLRPYYFNRSRNDRIS